jgi:4-amino-4-deoxy-L-arabinose transferase-like glycosyltransferase
MSSTRDGADERERALTTVLAATACALFALVVIARWPLLGRPFSSEGEAREAHVIADVVREGHWIAPYPNGDWIPTKGPLLYWWAGAAASVFGLGEGVLRLSIAALNLGTILATAWLGRLLGSARAGWLAGAMLATCFLFSGYAFYLRVDPGLVLCTTLSLASFAWGLAQPPRRRIAFLASHVALAGALFAKGLPALLPTLLPILAVLAWRRDAAGLRTYGFSALLLAAVAAAKVGGWASGAAAACACAVALSPWLRAPRPRADALLDLIPGLVLVGLVGGWLALADARYPVPYLSRAVDDSLNRVGQTMHGDPFLKPPWFYLPRFPGDFFPWSIFLPAAIVAAVRRVRLDRRDLRMLALVCLLGGFAVFSAIAYKRKVYLMPLYPPAAVLVALVFDERGARAVPRADRRWLDASLWVVVALGVAAASASAIDLATRAVRDGGLLAFARAGRVTNGLRPHGALVDLALLAAGALWASALHWSRRRGASAAALAIAGGMAILLAGPVTLLELANARRAQTPDVFAESVRRALPPGAELRFAPNIRDEGLLFYIARRVPTTRDEDLQAVLEGAPPSGVYLIAHRADALPADARVQVTTITRGVGSNGPLVLLRAVPRGDPAQPVAR